MNKSNFIQLVLEKVAVLDTRGKLHRVYKKIEKGYAKMHKESPNKQFLGRRRRQIGFVRKIMQGDPQKPLKNIKPTKDYGLRDAVKENIRGYNITKRTGTEY